jgi:hypothetical protein
MISSIVIVSQPKGHIAHLRFKDRKHDIDMGHADKLILYRLIEGYIYKRGLA